MTKEGYELKWIKNKEIKISRSIGKKPLIYPGILCASLGVLNFCIGRRRSRIKKSAIEQETRSSNQSS